MRADSLLLGAGVIALGASLVAEPEVLAAASVRMAAAEQLRELGSIAGLRGPDGRPNELRPLSVEVVQEGGPLWLAPAISEALGADGRFVASDPPSQRGGAVAPPAMIRAELVGAIDAHALRLQLWRRGAAASPPEPTRRRVVPWALVLGVALGGAVARLRGMFASSLAVAVVLQGLSLFLPWPSSLAPASVGETLSTGPLAVMLVALARGLSDAGVAVACGLVVGSALLALFDHRRSRKTGRSLGAVGVVRGLLGALAGLASVEAALRLGLLPWIASGWGALGLVGACLVALGTRLARRSAAP